MVASPNVGCFLRLSLLLTASNFIELDNFISIMDFICSSTSKVRIRVQQVLPENNS